MTSLKMLLMPSAWSAASIPVATYADLAAYLGSQSDPLHLVLGEPLLRTIIELGRAWALVSRHLLRVLEAIVNDHVGLSEKLALNHLLEDTQGLHEITLLKRDPRDFSNHEIRREAERGKQMRELYELSSQL